MKNLREMIAKNEEIRVEDVTAKSLMNYFVNCAEGTFYEWEETARIEPELVDFYKFREGYVRIKENEDIIFDLFSLRQLREIAKNIKETADAYIEKGADIIFSSGKHEAWIKALSNDTSWAPEGIMQTTKFVRVFETKLKSEIEVPILNTTILTQDGEFQLKTITIEEAKAFISDKQIKSYVGHDSTAKALSLLLDREVTLSRELYTQQKGETALCFKLRGRIETGQDLDWETIEKMGYDLKLLRMK